MTKSKELRMTRSEGLAMTKVVPDKSGNYKMNRGKNLSYGRIIFTI
jgi:hypothetical protein